MVVCQGPPKKESFLGLSLFCHPPALGLYVILNRFAKSKNHRNQTERNRFALRNWEAFRQSKFFVAFLVASSYMFLVLLP